MTEYFQELRERLELPGYDPYRNIKKILKFLVVILILALVALVGFRLFELAQGRLSMKADILATFMNTRVEIKAYGPGAKEAAGLAIAEMERVARLLDAFDPRSEISLINNMSGTASVAVSKGTLDVILKSIKLSELTNGAFDISVGPLIDLWDFGRKGDFSPPAAFNIKEALRLVNYSRIEIDPDVGSVMLPVRGMKLSLGAIGKGYIVSIGRNVLLSRGIKCALISTGSSISCIGARPDGKAWEIGIRSPRTPEKLLGTISLDPGQSLSTSGDYQRFVVVNGTRYHHILDPYTGYPAPLCEAVTIVYDDSTAADALSTAVFVMGPKKGSKFLKNLGSAQGLIVDAQGNLITTPGLKFEKGEGI